MNRAHVVLFMVLAGATAPLAASCSSSTDNPGPDASTADSGHDATTQDSQAQDSAAQDSAAQDSGAGDAAGDALVSCVSLGAIDGGQPTVCSDAGAIEAGLVVTNGCAESVDLWWVDYQCTEEYYQTIPPGGSAGQSSFVTHPWRVRLLDAGRVVKEIPPLTGDTNVSVP